MKDYLDGLAEEYESPAFISDDPISIPHKFTKLQDIEISAFFTATIAWGRRDLILRSANRLLDIMHGEPYDFVLNPSESQLKSLNKFVHRTFQPVDALYFHEFLKKHYHNHESLESAFHKYSYSPKKIDDSVGNSLAGFHHYFMHLSEAPKRTRKHVANPLKNSSCKRLNMFLRWMVRPDAKGVDFGLWNSINLSDLHLPLDVHVGNIAREWNLLSRKQNDWKAVIELSNKLRKYDPRDPAKYDYALFGYAINS